jgi:hypothetical protein
VRRNKSRCQYAIETEKAITDRSKGKGENEKRTTRNEGVAVRAFELTIPSRPGHFSRANIDAGIGRRVYKGVPLLVQAYMYSSTAQKQARQATLQYDHIAHPSHIYHGQVTDHDQTSLWVLRFGNSDSSSKKFPNLISALIVSMPS